MTIKIKKKIIWNAMEGVWKPYYEIPVKELYDKILNVKELADNPVIQSAIRNLNTFVENNWNECYLKESEIDELNEVWEKYTSDRLPAKRAGRVKSERRKA